MNIPPHKNPAAGSNAPSSHDAPSNAPQQLPLAPRTGQRMSVPGLANSAHVSGAISRPGVQVPAGRHHGVVQGMRPPQGIPSSLGGGMHPSGPSNPLQGTSYGSLQHQSHGQQMYTPHQTQCLPSSASVQARQQVHSHGRPVSSSSLPQSSWGVPNPLASATAGEQTMPLGHGVFNMSRAPSSTGSRPMGHAPQSDANGQPLLPNGNTASQPMGRPIMYSRNTAAQSRQTAPPPAPRQPGYTMAPAPAGAGGSSSGKPRVVLSPEARKALASAIWSAIRSPEGVVDPQALAQAVATGLPRQAVLNAARVAREREALKKKAAEQQLRQKRQQQQLQQQQLQQQIQLQKPSPAPAPKVTSSSVVSQAAAARAPTVPHRTPVSSQPRATTILTSSTAAAASHSSQQAALIKARVEERSKWKRAQSGVFVVQKGRFQALPSSIGAVARSRDVNSALSKFKPTRKRPRVEIRQKAAHVQQMLLQAREQKASHTPPIRLLDPEKFKRVKIEPKRVAKALDRTMRKSRSATADGLIKQHKELSKSIMAHQSEFFKYHRQRRSEAYRLAKSVRDSLDKEEKKKEKEADQAERARLAALRANDMAAYSKLLEETKNERLKFLLDKTDDCIGQISALLQKRSDEERNAAEFASASSASTGSYYASAHLKTEDVRQPTILVGGELKEYQIAGLQWMVSLYNNKLNGILADEMGLGKTIQAISLISYLMEFKNNLGPYLIIVPLSTLSNWENEFVKWCPSARVISYKGTPQQRKEIYREQVRTGHFNVLLTTYEYIIRDKASLRKQTWQYAIVDEGHRMKNAQSKFAVTLSTQYTTNNRILLTGTPLQNSLPELWALLNFLLPSVFNSAESFDQWFNRPFAQYGSSSSSEDGTDQMLTNEERMLIIHRLHELLRPFMLRRVKSEVLDQLPEKVEKVLRCDLSSWQKELYKQISAKANADKSLMGTFVEQPTRGLNNVVMQLRKVCNHPFLFSPEGYHIDDNLIRSSGKMHLLDQMLPKLKAAGHRVLMFTQMTAVMTILEDYFAYRGYASLRLDGSTPAEEREKRMYQFNAPDSPYFIFLLSTRAGGLGLNLASANVVIIFDSDWNPMMDLQAMDRAHRIGQRSDVSVFRLVTNSPVEEKILSRASEKLNMSELVVEAGKFDKSSVENDNSLERKRMMEVLLTDFEPTTSQVKSSDIAESESADDVEGDADSDGSDNENLNELLSNNEADFELYTEIDNALADTHLHLYTSIEDVPDWIKHPTAPSGAPIGGATSMKVLGESRKRKAVSYDDGLTEKQFIRLMEKQAIEEEKQGKKRKVAKSSRGQNASQAAAKPQVEDGPGPPGTLTEWTFRKLISLTKMVIALKDPTTKRRISEVFLEKPCASTYPDYYEMIEHPIAINDILRKCRGHLYSDVQEFRDDWKLLFANARKFNGDDSWVSQDATALEKELERVMKKNGFGEAPPPPKRKPLRIKLSLKKIKASSTDEAEPADDGNTSSTTPSAKPKKGGKKRGRKAKSKAQHK